MAKSPPDDPAPTGYLAWSRDPAVGLFAVLPLWLCYEGLRLLLTPKERNGAEALISESLRWLGPNAFLMLRVVLMGVVIAAAVKIVRRRLPWLRITVVNILEGMVYGLMLGPLAGALEITTTRVLAIVLAAQQDRLLADLVGSLGAGLFEELLFRMVLLSVLALLLIRVARAFGLPRVVGVATAVFVSAVLFSLFHHLGPGAAPFEQRVFVFRAMAGLVLGLLFVVRGFGVVVYAHALYDVFFYLTR